MAEKLLFTWIDYLIFCAILGICILIGLIQGIRDRWGLKNKDSGKAPGTDRDMKMLPVIWSIVATSFSSSFVLGVPAEVYYINSEIGVLCIGFVIGIPTGIYMFVKKLYELEVPSVFDYIGMRFGSGLKGFLTVLYAVSMLVYMGLIIYAPSLALGNSTSLPVWGAVLITGGICIIYTTLGGLRGVLYIDTMLILIVLVMGLVMCGYGSHVLGGIDEVWDIASNGSRITWPTWNADPTIRHSFWSCTTGGVSVIWLLIVNQAITQKFLALPNMKQVYITGAVYLIAVIVYTMVYILVGWTMYAYYVKIGCEPTQVGNTERADQIAPYYVLDGLRIAPGVAGLFNAAVYGASLSTVAAGINALAALTVRDVVYPLYKKSKGHPVKNQKLGIVIFKCLTVLWGMLALAVAFVAPYMGHSVMQIGLSLLAMTVGPLVGSLILGMYVPFSEKIGTFVGVTASIIFEGGILIGATITGAVIPKLQPLPSIQHCPVDNTSAILTSPTMIDTTTTSYITQAPQVSLEEPNAFFRISYLLYAPLGILITIIMGILVSGIVRCIKGDCWMEIPEVDKKLLCSWCIPKSNKEPIIDSKEAMVYKNGGFIGDVPEDDGKPGLKQAADLPTVTSIAFAKENEAYSKEQSDYENVRL